jgi:MFS family permease
MSGAPDRGVLFRLCAAAFLADLALYLVMTGVPYKAIALGAGPFVLGLLPAARALPYSLTTVGAGSRAEVGARLRRARRTLVLGALAAAGLLAVPAIPWIFVLLAVVGVALAFFWPALQATLADLAGEGPMGGNLGWFNIAWSTGKSCGFLVGGALLAGLGFPALFAAAGASLLAVAWLVRTLPAGGGPAPVPVQTTVPPGEGALPPAGPAPRAAGRFRTAAWIANATTFGIGAVLNHQYPKFLEELGRGEAFFGVYLGGIFAAQTLTFLVLMRTEAWHYRAAPLILAQVPVAGALALLPVLRQPVLILVTAPVVGFGLGVTYFASIYYSVASPRDRGRNAGMHEALLGAGALLLPFLGGWVAEATGRLSAPYLLAAGAGIVSIGAQAGLLFGTGKPIRG